MTDGLYNPLDKRNLARSIEVELLARPTVPLADIGAIKGAGVYAIYYSGGFEPYAPLFDRRDGKDARPIYVGKAIPKGGRKGGLLDSPAIGTALSGRLRQHAESIKAVQNLGIGDFSFRCLILDDIWIPLGETILIESFKPLWNIAIDGFGNNDPGKGRLNQKRSPWDVLHPGRGHAERLLGGTPDLKAVMGRVEDHFSGRPLRKLPRALEIAAKDARAGEGEEA